MDPSRIVHFKKTEEIFDIAQKLFNEQKNFLLDNIPSPVDVQHVGSSSIPGALTQADLDIQIRTTKENFEKTVGILKRHFDVKHLDNWTNEFVSFTSIKNILPTDFIVTIEHSRYDHFYKTRDYLKAHPEMLSKYNAMKQLYEGKIYSEYSDAKKLFFCGNEKVRFLKVKFLDY